MGQRSVFRTIVMHSDYLVDAGLAAALARHADIQVLEPCPTSLRSGERLCWLAGQAADIVITDYDRGLWILDAAQRGHVPFSPVLPRTMIVTDRVTQAEIHTALKNGVAGYLTVTTAAEETINAVRKVGMGVRHISEGLAGSLIDDLLGEKLTPRESEVLKWVALGSPNKVIAARLNIELGTVKCHMRSVLQKLGAGNRTEAVVIANRRGLLALRDDGNRPNSVPTATGLIKPGVAHADVPPAPSRGGVGVGVGDRSLHADPFGGRGSALAEVHAPE
jgi:DNA-binding NarL/FixJ family response regulator